MINERADEGRVEVSPATLEVKAGKAEKPATLPSDAADRDAAPEGARAAAEIAARLERLPFTRYNLQMAIILALGGMCALFAVTVTKPLETDLRDTFHLSAVEVGWAGAVTLLGSLVAERLTALLGKRLAPRRALALSFVAYGAFSAASGLAWNFTSLLVFRTLMGFGSGVMICQIGTVLRERSGSPYHRRLVVTALIAPPFGIMASTLLGSVALSMFSDETAWRVVLLIGGVPLLVGLYAVVRLPESPRWLAARGRHAEADRIVRGFEESVLRKGFDLKEPHVTLETDLTPRVPVVLSKPYVRRTLACALPALMVFATYNIYFQ